MEIDTLINQFLSEQKVSPNTLQHYREDLAQFSKYLTAKNITKLGQPLVANYKTHLNKLQLSKYTRLNYLRMANRFLTYLKQHNHTDFDLKFTLPKIERIRPANRNTLNYAILVADTFEEPAKSRYKLIAALIYLNKLKLAEIINLKLADINLETMELRLFSRQLFLQLKKKTVPYLLGYLKHRQNLQTNSDFLFLTAAGQRLTYSKFQKHFKLWSPNT